MVIRNKSKKVRSTRAAIRSPKYWIVATLAAGAIVAFTADNSRAMTIGFLKGKEIVATRADKDTYSEKIDFNIPAGNLSDVISAFEKAAGMKVAIDNERFNEIQSPGVVGRFTPTQALVILLEGTGLKYQVVDKSDLKVVAEAEGATVVIVASTNDVLESTKYSDVVGRLPQTIDVISSKTIREQGATTLRDVLNNVPGITITAGEGGTPAGDNLNIRGFSARNDVYIDGARDLGPQSRDPFAVEQVEVVKGPNSAFSGRGSTGGTVNLVSKLPNLRRTASGDLTVGNAHMKRATIDANLPVNDKFAFRLAAMGQDSDMPGREIVSNKRWGVSPSIFFTPKSDYRFYGSYFFLGQNNLSDYGIPWVPNTNNVLVPYRDMPAPVPRNTFYGFVDRDREKLRSDQGTFRFEHDFNEKITLRNQLRYGYSRRNSMATPPRFNNNNATLINREMRAWITNDNIWDNQTDLNIRFNTGSVQHTLVTGLALTNERNRRVARTAANATTSLYDPNPYDIYTGVITTSPLTADLTGKTIAGYIFDTVRLSKYFDLIGGIRLDRFKVSGLNVSGTSYVPLSDSDLLWSGRAAIVYHPIESVSLYAAYTTSANPSLEGLLYVPADVRTPPEKTRNFEIGSKWLFLKDRLTLSTAIFEVAKTNARTASVVAGDPPTLDGDQRVRGAEASVSGFLTSKWEMTAAYTLLDSEIVRSNTAPTLVYGVYISEVGKHLINTPRNSFNLWTTYRMGRFMFGGGPRYVGKRFGNNINTREVDDYWTLSAMGSVRLTKNIDFRVNGTNLGDKYFIDRIGGGHIVPGAGRSVIGTIGFNF